MVLRLVAVGTLAVALLAPEVASACSMVPPSAEIQIGMTPVSPRAGSEVRLTGGAGAESYAWDLDGDGQFDDAVGKVVTASFPAGQRTVAARASTASGVLTDTRTFTVHAWNATPTGTIRATPPNARAGVPVRVSAEGSDPDGPAVQTALDLDADGTFETAGATGTATFATPGQRVIRARFTDDGGASSVATTTLDVRAGNLPPTVSILAAISGSMCGDGKPRVVAADPDGELVRYEYDRDGDGTFETDRGSDASKPDHTFVGVRVTDDRGASATARRSGLGMDAWTFPDSFPFVAQVGAPIKLSVSNPGAVGWDADGDGDFDDGTGKEIVFTYPSTGTYEVRVREASRPSNVSMRTISVREAADIAPPTASWNEITPGRPAVASSVGYAVAGPLGADARLDLDGDGRFDDAAPGGNVTRAFGGPATIALRAVDAFGRTAETTTQVPFGAGNFGPDAVLISSDVDAPLTAVFDRAKLWGYARDVESSWLAVSWDTDGDDEFDDPAPTGTEAAGALPASVAVRATDTDGDTVTLRRSLTAASSLDPATPSARLTTPVARLQVAARRPKLATLLRRGMTVDVKCPQPRCRTSLTAKVDAKTARKLGLRSRTVASRTVSGTRRVTLKLTPKARRALRSVRSVKLVLTAKAVADGGVKSTWTSTFTIRRSR